MPPFRYESQDTTLPYVGTIADLIQAGPNARAQGELRKGQAIGNAAASIGQTIGAIPGQIQQAQLNTQRLEAGKLELDAAKRAETAREAMNKLMADPSVLNEDGTFNWQEMQKKIPGADAQSLVGIVGPINDSILKTRDHQLQLRALKQASLGELATGILQISKGNPQAAEQLLHVGLSSAVKSGLMTQPEADQMITGFAQDPTQLLPTLELLARAAKRPDIKLSEGEELRSGIDPTRVIADNPKPAPMPTQASLAMQAAGGDAMRATEILQGPAQETARHNAAMERIAQMTAGRSAAAQAETARHNAAMEAQAGTDLVQTAGPDGKPVWTPKREAAGKPAARANQVATGQQKQIVAFYNRAQEADDIAKPLEEKIAKMSLAGQAYSLVMPNVLQTKMGQSYRQAQRAFTEARLRKESGAQVPDSEYANDEKTYWAQPGDSKETLEQKRQARQTVLDGLKFSAGSAYEDFYGQPADYPSMKKSATNTGSKFTVTAPDGNTYAFPSQVALDAFKKSAGIP